MITYQEFKVLVRKILGNRDTDLESGDISVDFSRSHYTPLSGSENSQLVIKDEELLDLYTRVSLIKNEGLQLYDENHFEIAVELDYPMMRNREVSAVIDDTVNGVHYRLDLPSLEYSIFLLMKLGEAYNERNLRRLVPMRLRRPFELFRNNGENTEITLEMLFPRMIGEMTLRIHSDSPYSLSKFKRLETSFLFQFMYLSDISLIEYKDIVDIFRINISPRNRFDFSQIDTPSFREYAEDVVDYYKLALSSNDPYIRYISFYHIMEYFYDEVFKKKLVDDLKNRITHPSFSYKNDEKIYDIALFVKNRLKTNAQDGQGNELESLKFVLSKFVNIDDLKNRVNSIDDSAVLYYQNTKVPFCNAPVIGWNDNQGVFTQLARRIYFTRNSLVHSKSGKNDERYRPYRDEPQLQREIPLVKAVAELIIINSSKMV